MRKAPIWVVTIAMFVIGAIFLSCQTMEKPAVASAAKAGPMKEPVIELEAVEITQYFGFWHYGKDVPPTKGKAGNNGAPLPVAFVFNITNPNSEPIFLEELKFTIAFEEFDVNTVMSTDTQWIPGGKTNQLRVSAMFDTQQTFYALMLPGAMKLKEKGVSAWDLLEKWWTAAPNMSFPISVKEGAATFKMDDKTIVVPFSGSFGG